MIFQLTNILIVLPGLKCSQLYIKVLGVVCITFLYIMNMIVIVFAFIAISCKFLGRCNGEHQDTLVAQVFL